MTSSPPTSPTSPNSQKLSPQSLDSPVVTEEKKRESPLLFKEGELKERELKEGELKEGESKEGESKEGGANLRDLPPAKSITPPPSSGRQPLVPMLNIGSEEQTVREGESQRGRSRTNDSAAGSIPLKVELRLDTKLVSLKTSGDPRRQRFFFSLLSSFFFISFSFPPSF